MGVLLVSRDDVLVEEVGRLAAAAGVEPRVRAPDAALAEWAGATAVLVGADAAPMVAGLRPARRSGVHVVGLGPLGVAVFRSGVEVGAESVAELPASAQWLVGLLTDVDEPPSRGLTVGVVGGAGGAGATTLACALAQTGAGAGDTLLVDTDPVGPGLDRLLGLELTDGVRWHDLARTPGRLAARALRESVPRHRQLGVLTWSAGAHEELDPAVAREVLVAGRRGHDLVVVDLARHGGATTAEVAGRCDRLWVVTPATVAGVAATVRLVSVLGPSTGRVGLVLRPGSVPVDEVEGATGLPVLAELRSQRGLSEWVDLGLGPIRSGRSPVARVARDLLGRAA